MSTVPDGEKNGVSSTGALRRRMLVGFVVGGLLCVSSLDEFVYQSVAGYISLALGLALLVSSFVTSAKVRRQQREARAADSSPDDLDRL